MSMAKIDEVSEKIGEVTTDIRTIKTTLNKIEKHLAHQNGRIGKLEAFKFKLVGISIALWAGLTILSIAVRFI